MADRAYDPGSDLAGVQHATDSLLSTAARLDAVSLAQPSLLPGWTRGHVLAHLARNADSLVNLLTWARTGVDTPAYASQAARDADIEAGSGLLPAEQLSDLKAGAERIVEAASIMPADRWSYEVRFRTGPARTADKILWARWQEVEVHHVDLDVDYTPAHWGGEFTAHALASTAKSFSEREDVTPLRLVTSDTDRTFDIGSVGPDALTVDGPEAALLAWLIGRSSGDGLVVQPHGSPLPVLPAWM